MAGGGVVAWRRGQGAQQSDRILGPWDEVGRGKWLLPDLRDALLVVPDRPHSHDEAMQAQVAGVIGRSRRCRVNTNAERIRGARPLEAKKPGTRRWLALGDSVTFGWGVEDEESWPAQLEARLRDEGHELELLNYGVPAQRIDAMSEFLKRIAPRLELDGVLLAERPEGNIGHYVQRVRQGMQPLGSMPLALVLPPISRFDPYGRSAYEREAAELQQGFGAQVPVVELTPAMWQAQQGLGADLLIEGETMRMVDAGGRVLVEAPRSERDLPAEIYAAFEADHDLKEGLFLDEGHPDAEGFGVLVAGLIPALEEAGWLS